MQGSTFIQLLPFVKRDNEAMYYICLYLHEETLIEFAENNDSGNLGDWETK